MRHSLKRSGLQMAMFELLLRLARSHGEKQRLTSLARELTVTTGGITRLVDRAENLGLVRREPCPDDARGSFAVLTEEGKRRLREALPDHLLEIDSLWMSQLADERDARPRQAPPGPGQRPPLAERPARAWGRSHLTGSELSDTDNG